MPSLVYVPATSATRISLSGPLVWAQDKAAGIRGREWARTIGYRSLLQANRPAREVTLTAYASNAAADQLRRAADADVLARRAGTLVFNGEWSQRAYILQSAPKPHHGGVLMDLTVALMDGAWWSVRSTSFTPDEGSEYEYLDYPFDYSHDYAISASSDGIDTGLLSPSPVLLRIYGPAVSPYVDVGSNRYQLNVTIPSGGYVTVDGREKTIVLTLQDGTKTNAFASGERGSGAGGGAYIFEDVPAGYSVVSWDGSFGFDLGWYDMEGEPPWNQF